VERGYREVSLSNYFGKSYIYDASEMKLAAAKNVISIREILNLL